MKKVLFLDRDGCLIVEPGEVNPENPHDSSWVPYQIDSIEKLEFMPGVLEALKQLKAAGFIFVLISNQDGLGTDIFPQKAFDAPQQVMLRVLAENDLFFEEIFICPHFPEANCECRKPQVGPALRHYLNSNPHIQLKESYMIGDRDSDVKLAFNIGCKGIQINSKNPWPKIANTILNKTL